MASSEVLTARTELTSVGCGRKLPPRLLKALLADVDTDGALAKYIGNDCGITEPGSQTQLHTVDIVLPMGMEPETWGRIVALHCVSDIYASGGVPVSATGILQLSQEWIREDWHVVSYRGAIKQLSALDVKLVGGHTLRGQVTSMGFAVTGTCAVDALRSRRLAAPGDVLVLTKPIGGSLVLGANEFSASALAPGDYDEVIDSMLKPNDVASKIAGDLGVRSSTDISGFGLLGSCLELSGEAGVRAMVDFPSIPIFAGVSRALTVGVVSPLAESVMIDSDVEVEWADLAIADKLVLCDPQVSGGLLLAMPRNVADTKFIPEMNSHGLSSWIVGVLAERPVDEKTKVIVTGGAR